MNKIKTTMLILSILLLLVVGVVSANVDHQGVIEEGKKFVESGIGCNELSDEQLEDIGMYYMEQMHPGGQHEMMDNMMGGGDSESLKQMHIKMANVLYCGESGGVMDSGGMMGMMGGENNMMDSGGMMSGSMGLWSIIGFVFWIALLIALILLIIWLYKKITGKANGNGSALEILKKRFAKGEITKKEFENMKKDVK